MFLQHHLQNREVNLVSVAFVFLFTQLMAMKNEELTLKYYIICHKLFIYNLAQFMNTTGLSISLQRVCSSPEGLEQCP